MAINIEITGVQETLISGTNIKSLNGQTLLGSGELQVTNFFTGNQIQTGNRTHNGGGFTTLIQHQNGFHLENDTTSDEILFDLKNFAGQGQSPDDLLYSFVVHHYSDGHLAQLDNVGQGDILRLVNAQNTTHRADKPDNYAGSGNFLALITTPQVQNAQQRTIMEIDPNGYFIWPGTDDISFFRNKMLANTSGDYSFQFQLDNQRTRIMSIDDKIFIQSETSTRNVIASHKDLRIYTNLAETFDFKSGQFGIGVQPAAYLHIKAGTSTIPQIRLDAGVLKTTIQNGAIEYDGTNLYFTTGGVRRQIQLA